MIHNTGQSKAFLDAWDVTLEAETSEKLTAIVKESIVMAKNQYNTNIYAVVSDNAAAMLKMGRDVDIWHNNCSSHTGNLLTKDVMDVELNKKVLSVLKEFKHSNFEKALVDVGGSRIKTPVETRWCTYRDSYECLVKNIQQMKTLICTDDRFKKIKPTVKSLIFDDEFLDNVKDYILLFQPICSLINICQNPEVSIAESANLWLNLKLPSKFNELNLHLDRRREMACNLYTKCAYYLHPKFHDNAKKILSQNQLESISEFLINELDSEGLSSLSEFQESKGIFRALKNKQITDPIVFWNMAKIHHKSLANLAAKLMKIPAASATLERVFSNWSFVHSPLRNRLDFERSTKITTYILHTHKIMDTNKCDDY